MLKKLNKNNLLKTYYYLKKNGIQHTIYAAWERITSKEMEHYSYIPKSEEILQEQKNTIWEEEIKISIVVPAYETKKEYLKEMIDSVLEQSYENFELIIVDASREDTLKAVIEGINDKRIQYVFLGVNEQIAANTNKGLLYATGDYVGFLDHDDVLTKDALYEVVAKIEGEKKEGIEVKMIYSDEDKCNESLTDFYQVHKKPKFNLDLIMTNNYICHFLVVESELAKKIAFRSVCDGAQDFDFVLRCVKEILPNTEKIVHIDKVLYHWRCHMESTASNPQSKLYAYEAGKRAVEDFAKTMGWKVEVGHLKHLGFYYVEYLEDIFIQRPEIGAIGGPVYDVHNKVISGLMNTEGVVLYKGLRKGFSGYMNRAILSQQAEAIDLRNMKINKMYEELFKEVVGVSYEIDEKTKRFDWKKLPNETEFISLSLKLSKRLKEEGAILLWR